MCDVEKARELPRRPVTDIVVVTIRSGGREVSSAACNVRVRNGPAPQVTGLMVRERAERLLPHPLIGVAPPGHVTLVNIETVFWADTSAQRNLGTVTILGQRVELRAHIERVRWHFGDGATATTTNPGRAYTASDPCDTAQCPGYFGHTYTATGSVTITADIAWTGQYRVANSAWQPIPGTVTAAATATGIAVEQARAILVPNP